MVKETEPSIPERAFILQALKEGYRLDCRNKLEFRNIDIKLGREFGHAEVQLGSTRVFAKVSCEVTRPYEGRPTEGILVLNTEMSPMAVPSLEPGRPSEDEVLASRIIEKALKRSNAIDTEGLCIVAGEKVWTIRIDIHFLDHDGNVVDAACIAALTALSHFRRPDVTVAGTDVTIHSLKSRNPVPLSIHHMPICVTFAFFDNGNLFVVDPLHREEQVREGDMTLTINKHREICAISKAGGIPLELETIVECSQIAALKVKDITALIQAALDRDAQERKFGTVS
ncbi:2022_t:CDS:2 [Paraglomus occultum]|uniref:Exosome complex component RRP45 n=1 Tax=Paraglomus occultum TaxID=144539 RepID=A0A9N9CXU2_9GLOM|nr:2022_t:CDS:2 [Paraglomus occultum]